VMRRHIITNERKFIESNTNIRNLGRVNDYK
jgi:hypothetical protein